ncbi:hypothetical protein [Nocardioides sp. LHG3406-4]|uniref:hypothetical protein n=1 Tax=Nocardioides sp. LHG3406-4 TaxID=2804575 RepID=UPI003CF653D3
MLQLLVAVMLVAVNARYAGERGARRYDALPDDRARVEHESFVSRAFDWLILINVAVAAVEAGLSASRNAWVGAAISTGALVLSLLARALFRSARSNVGAGFAKRGTDPLHRRETSARGERRQKQFAATALGGYLTFRVLGVTADRTGETWLVAPAVLAIALAIGGALALVWSMAWRYGDERPA